MPYKVLNRDELEQQRRKALAEVTSVLNISEDVAMRVLRKYKCEWPPQQRVNSREGSMKAAACRSCRRSRQSPGARALRSQRLELQQGPRPC